MSFWEEYNDRQDCAVFCKGAPPQYRCKPPEKGCECCVDCKWLKMSKKERRLAAEEYATRKSKQ